MPNIISRFFSHIKQIFQYFCSILQSFKVAFDPFNRFGYPLILKTIMSALLSMYYKNIENIKSAASTSRLVGEESGELIYKFCRWLSCQVGILQAPCSTSFCLNACFSRLLFLSCFQSFFCCYSRSSIDAAFSFTSEKIFETKTNLI